MKPSLLVGVDVPMKSSMLLSSLVILCTIYHNFFIYTTLSSQLLHIPNLFCSGNVLLLGKLMGNLLLAFQMFLEHQIPLNLNPGVLAHELVHAPNCWALDFLLGLELVVLVLLALLWLLMLTGV